MKTRRASRSFSAEVPSSAMRYHRVILSRSICAQIWRSKKIVDGLSPLVSSKMLTEDTDIVFDIALH
jgi:hypothetical protein